MTNSMGGEMDNHQNFQEGEEGQESFDEQQIV
jgi:hypothetical protein